MGDGEDKGKQDAGKGEGQDETINLEDLFPAEDNSQHLDDKSKGDEGKGDDKGDKGKDDKKDSASVEQVRNELSKKSDRQFEVVQFFNSEQGKLYQQYAREISRAATDPRFISLPLDRVIGLTLKPDVIMKIGAKMQEQAKEEAKANGTGGHSANGDSAAPKDLDAWGMPKEDFDKMKQNALMGKFVSK